ncbi:MAG: transposase [Anaerolineales bacterium]|nr:transposase [Anaerolineales bacterium]
MSTIPTRVTAKQFEDHIRPCRSTAQRGYVCSIPLYKVLSYIPYRLHTGCRWERLPSEPDPTNPHKKEISWQAVYYHFHKWSHDGSWEAVLLG